MITLQNLTFSYVDNKPVIHDINLNITDGEYMAVIGANGSGKTTLIRHFNGLLRPTKGEVIVNGLSTSKTKNLPEIRRSVGMIFQNPDNQIVGMTVEEDVAFGPGNIGLPSAEIRRRVDRALERVGLADYKTRAPHSLSGGQKQLLAVASVLAMDCSFIVLDEPTASLDPESNHKVLQLLKKLNQQGIGIIHVTHNMEELYNAQRVLVMNNGEIIADGLSNDILSRVEWLKSLGLAPPKIMELMWYLRQRGHEMETGMFAVDKAGEEIIKRLAGKSLQACR